MSFDTRKIMNPNSSTWMGYFYPFLQLTNQISKEGATNFQCSNIEFQNNLKQPGCLTLKSIWVSKTYVKMNTSKFFVSPFSNPCYESSIHHNIEGFLGS